MIYKKDNLDNFTDIVIKRQLMKKYYQSNICLEKLFYIRERLTPRAFNESYAVVIDDLRALQIEIDTLEDVKKQTIRKPTTQAQAWEETLFLFYASLNNTLWALVRAKNMNHLDYTILEKQFEMYKGKINSLEHLLYFNGRTDDEVLEIDRLRSHSVSEVIPGFERIKIM